MGLGRTTMRNASVWSLLFILGASMAASGALPTTNNDDSCDISALPAATLLLPYFEVDIDSETGENTLLTIANVTQAPQIARVTLWTDWAFPVFSFNLYLTGYDVQSISLLDLLRFGSIAPSLGTSSTTRPGERSVAANPLLDVSACSGPLMKRVPDSLIEDLQRALTIGRTSSCATAVGGNHGVGKATGYATIDVVKSCDASLPTDAGYFAEQILFDNVLTGDYQQLNVAESFAQGGTLVHIRAIPEGGAPGAIVPTFTRTFYGRLQSGGTVDRRQPLPSSFAARWITGGTGQFNTAFKIWREGEPPKSDVCAVQGNETVFVPEVVRFDEDENPTALTSDCGMTCPPIWGLNTPSASRLTASDRNYFPPNAGADVAGWMYLNLDNDRVALGPGGNPNAGQSWVIASMAADGQFSIDVDATALGNGCSPPAPPFTPEDGGSPAVAPAPNENAKPAGLAATTNNDDSCDIMQAPAATLLLPLFEVDLYTPGPSDTVFTITNVVQSPQIARVTIWSDRGYPVLTFNVFLTGYDIQPLSLLEILRTGRIAPPNGATSDVETGARSLSNDDNPLLDISICDDIAVDIPPAILADLRTALTTGLTSSCGTLRVGGMQPDGYARGYVTIDVVANCDSTGPTDPGYVTGDLLHDNVFTGDYQQIDRYQKYAQSGALVHIRAIPEGGPPGGATTNFLRTFYSRYQPMGGTADRRQPLPSTFAARWISGGTDHFNTSFKIWREGVTGADAECTVRPNAEQQVTEFVRFDEDENPTSYSPPVIPCLGCEVTLPAAASRVSAADTNVFPPYPGEGVAGWMYMNIDNVHPLGAIDPDVASQNWVTVSMVAAGRFSVDFDATALGNGCSGVANITSEDKSPPAIGPAPNTNPR